MAHILHIQYGPGYAKLCAPLIQHIQNSVPQKYPISVQRRSITISDFIVSLENSQHQVVRIYTLSADGWPDNTQIAQQITSHCQTFYDTFDGSQSSQLQRSPNQFTPSDHNNTANQSNQSTQLSDSSSSSTHSSQTQLKPQPKGYQTTLQQHNGLTQPQLSTILPPLTNTSIMSPNAVISNEPQPTSLLNELNKNPSLAALQVQSIKKSIALQTYINAHQKIQEDRDNEDNRALYDIAATHLGGLGTQSVARIETTQPFPTLQEEEEEEQQQQPNKQNDSKEILPIPKRSKRIRVYFTSSVDNTKDPIYKYFQPLHYLRLAVEFPFSTFLFAFTWITIFLVIAVSLTYLEPNFVRFALSRFPMQIESANIYWTRRTNPPPYTQTSPSMEIQQSTPPSSILSSSMPSSSLISFQALNSNSTTLSLPLSSNFFEPSISSPHFHSINFTRSEQLINTLDVGILPSTTRVDHSEQSHLNTSTNVTNSRPIHSITRSIQYSLLQQQLEGRKLPIHTNFHPQSTNTTLLKTLNTLSTPHFMQALVSELSNASPQDVPPAMLKSAPNGGIDRLWGKLAALELNSRVQIDHLNQVSLLRSIMQHDIDVYYYTPDDNVFNMQHLLTIKKFEDSITSSEKYQKYCLLDWAAVDSNGQVFYLNGTSVLNSATQLPLQGALANQRLASVAAAELLFGDDEEFHNILNQSIANIVQYNQWFRDGLYTNVTCMLPTGVLTPSYDGYDPTPPTPTPPTPFFINSEEHDMTPLQASSATRQYYAPPSVTCIGQFCDPLGLLTPDGELIEEVKNERIARYSTIPIPLVGSDAKAIFASTDEQKLSSFAPGWYDTVDSSFGAGTTTANALKTNFRLGSPIDQYDNTAENSDEQDKILQEYIISNFIATLLSAARASEPDLVIAFDPVQSGVLDQIFLNELANSLPLIVVSILTGTFLLIIFVRSFWVGVMGSALLLSSILPAFFAYRLIGFTYFGLYHVLAIFVGLYAGFDMLYVYHARWDQAERFYAPIPILSRSGRLKYSKDKKEKNGEDNALLNDGDEDESDDEDDDQRDLVSAGVMQGLRRMKPELLTELALEISRPIDASRAYMISWTWRRLSFTFYQTFSTHVISTLIIAFSIIVNVSMNIPAFRVFTVFSCLQLVFQCILITLVWPSIITCHRKYLHDRKCCLLFSGQVRDMSINKLDTNMSYVGHQAYVSSIRNRSNNTTAFSNPNVNVTNANANANTYINPPLAAPPSPPDMAMPEIITQSPVNHSHSPHDIPSAFPGSYHQAQTQSSNNNNTSSTPPTQPQNQPKKSRKKGYITDYRQIGNGRLSPTESYFQTHVMRFVMKNRFSSIILLLLVLAVSIYFAARVTIDSKSVTGAMFVDNHPINSFVKVQQFFRHGNNINVDFVFGLDTAHPVDRSNADSTDSESYGSPTFTTNFVNANQSFDLYQLRYCLLTVCDFLMNANDFLRLSTPTLLSQPRCLLHELSSWLESGSSEQYGVPKTINGLYNPGLDETTFWHAFLTFIAFEQDFCTISGASVPCRNKYRDDIVLLHATKQPTSPTGDIITKLLSFRFQLSQQSTIFYQNGIDLFWIWEEATGLLLGPNSPSLACQDGNNALPSVTADEAELSKYAPFRFPPTTPATPFTVNSIHHPVLEPFMSQLHVLLAKRSSPQTSNELLDSPTKPSSSSSAMFSPLQSSGMSLGETSGFQTGVGDIWAPWHFFFFQALLGKELLRAILLSCAIVFASFLLWFGNIFIALLAILPIACVVVAQVGIAFFFGIKISITSAIPLLVVPGLCSFTLFRLVESYIYSRGHNPYDKVREALTHNATSSLFGIGTIILSSFFLLFSQTALFRNFATMLWISFILHAFFMFIAFPALLVLLAPTKEWGNIYYLILSRQCCISCLQRYHLYGKVVRAHKRVLIRGDSIQQTLKSIQQESYDNEMNKIEQLQDNNKVALLNREKLLAQRKEYEYTLYMWFLDYNQHLHTTDTNNPIIYHHNKKQDDSIAVLTNDAIQVQFTPPSLHQGILHAMKGPLSQFDSHIERLLDTKEDYFVHDINTEEMLSNAMVYSEVQYFQHGNNALIYAQYDNIQNGANCCMKCCQPCRSNCCYTFSLSCSQCFFYFVFRFFCFEFCYNAAKSRELISRYGPQMQYNYDLKRQYNPGAGGSSVDDNIDIEQLPRSQQEQTMFDQHRDHFIAGDGDMATPTHPNYIKQHVYNPETKTWSNDYVIDPKIASYINKDGVVILPKDADVSSFALQRNKHIPDGLGGNEAATAFAVRGDDPDALYINSIQPSNKIVANNDHQNENQDGVSTAKTTTTKSTSSKTALTNLHPIIQLDDPNIFIFDVAPLPTTTSPTHDTTPPESNSGFSSTLDSQVRFARAEDAKRAHKQRAYNQLSSHQLAFVKYPELSLSNDDHLSFSDDDDMDDVQDIDLQRYNKILRREVYSNPQPQQPSQSGQNRYVTEPLYVPYNEQQGLHLSDRILTALDQNQTPPALPPAVQSTRYNSNNKTNDYGIELTSQPHIQ